MTRKKYPKDEQKMLEMLLTEANQYGKDGGTNFDNWFFHQPQRVYHTCLEYQYKEMVRLEYAKGVEEKYTSEFPWICRTNIYINTNQFDRRLAYPLLAIAAATHPSRMGRYIHKGQDFINYFYENDTLPILIRIDSGLHPIGTDRAERFVSMIMLNGWLENRAIEIEPAYYKYGPKTKHFWTGNQIIVCCPLPFDVFARRLGIFDSKAFQEFQDKFFVYEIASSDDTLDVSLISTHQPTDGFNEQRQDVLHNWESKAQALVSVASKR